ncbi:MAG: hypothetical protein P8Z00_00095 [Anaerolineales bacterium]|jgi:hypothetical protein
MKSRTFKLIAAIMMGLTIYLAVNSPTRTFGQQNISVDRATQTQILNATVQIRLFAPDTSAQPVGNVYPYVMSQGLGSLVREGENYRIITHNHWSLLDQVDFVKFYDANFVLLLEMSGTAFKDLILQQDAGTLVLQVPPEIIEKMSAVPGAFGEASLDDGLKLGAGDQVLVVHQKPGQEDKVEVIPAVIDRRMTFQGLPAFQLHASDGSALIPGDSGGGLWFNGYLVGDLWAREEANLNDWSQWNWQDFRPGVKVLENAYAAQFTMKWSSMQ